MVAAVAAAGAAGTGGTTVALSAPPSVPDTTMFSTAAATLAAARAALAVAQPCKKKKCLSTFCLAILNCKKGVAINEENVILLRNLKLIYRTAIVPSEDCWC